MTAALTAADATSFERCLASGGVVLFPADTVYGLGVDPESAEAVERLYEIKGRRADRPAAVMFFSLETPLALLGDLGARTREALAKLLPGPVTVVVPNPHRRFPRACGPAPERLGLRVPALPPALASLAAIERPVLQSSANPSGGRDARRLADIEARIRGLVDLEIDGGELPGTPSTVVDLTAYEADRTYALLREGALPAAELAARIGG